MRLASLGGTLFFQSTSDEQCAFLRRARGRMTEVFAPHGIVSKNFDSVAVLIMHDLQTGVGPAGDAPKVAEFAPVAPCSEREAEVAS
jgi:hypothetical protein